jgi:molecular chaperone GrpE
VTGEQNKEAEALEEPQTEHPVGEEVEAVEEEAAEDVDELTLLRNELEEARAKEAEYLDGWQRSRAELANARKRFQREREQAYSNAKADILTRLLSVVDDFERALETLSDNPSQHTWTEGVLLIHRKLQSLLEQDGVAAIEAVGQEFDPVLHQAITHEHSEEVPCGQVIGELQKGYTMGDRVLRPSMVRVSAGPEAEEEPQVAEEEGVAGEENAEA